MSEIELKKSTPNELNSFLDSQVPEEKLVWVPVGLKFREWFDKIDGWPVEQGTLINTTRGVFMIGMCGSFYVGKKLPDGTLDHAVNVRLQTDRENDVIIEYADTPNCGYTRDEQGRIVLPPDVEW